MTVLAQPGNSSSLEAAAHHLGLERQHHAELRQQAADAVQGGGALLDETLACAVHHQTRLLLLGLDRHEAHGGALHRLADGRGVGRIVLAAQAAHAIGRHELGRHQPNRVAMGGKQPGPVVGAGAGFDADEARRQGGHHFEQPGAWHARQQQFGLAGVVDTVQGKDVLGEIDSNGQNGHDFPFRVS